jgi:hypothetical protein
MIAYVLCLMFGHIRPDIPVMDGFILKVYICERCHKSIWLDESFKKEAGE